MGLVGLNATKILVGAGTFSIGPYTSSGSSGALQDIGHTMTPFELAGGFANFDVETERATEIVGTYPQKSDYTLKVSFAQNEPEAMRIAYRQTAGNLSGTAGTGETLRVGSAVAQYHQATLVVPGTGTGLTATYTFWKLQVATVDATAFGKAAVQQLVVTFRVIRDDTVATADKLFKRVDS